MNHWFDMPEKINGGIYLDWECKKMRTLDPGVYIPIHVSGSWKKRDKLISDLQKIIDEYFGQNAIVVE